jgi:quercetin dioxygenase-like cupin family protein
VATHSHNYLEIAFVLKGSGTHYLGGMPYTLQKGDVFFVNNELSHGFNVAPRETLTYINIAFLPEVLNQALTLEKLDAGFYFFMLAPFFSLEEGVSAVGTPGSVDR